MKLGVRREGGSGRMGKEEQEREGEQGREGEVNKLKDEERDGG